MKKMRARIALVIFIFAFLSLAGQATAEVRMRKKITKNVKLEHGEFESVNTANDLKCAELCMSNESCRSFNFQDSTGSCLLFDRVDGSTVPHLGSTSWYVTEGSNKEPTSTATTATTTATTATTTPNCRVGWRRFGDHCYRFLGTKTTYMAAKQNCEDQGAFLVSLLSAEEDTFVNDFARAHLETKYWIGLFKPAYASFSWEDGNAFGYSNWADGEPNGNLDKTACSYVGEGVGIRQWNDVYYSQCDSETKNSVCKYAI